MWDVHEESESESSEDDEDEDEDEEDEEDDEDELEDALDFFVGFVFDEDALWLYQGYYRALAHGNKVIHWFCAMF